MHLRRMPRMLLFLLAYLAWRAFGDEPVLLLGAVTVGVVGFVAYRWWTDREAERQRTRRDEAVRERLAGAAEMRFPAVADRILALEDRVTLADSPQVGDHFRRATGAFMAADEAMATAATTDGYTAVLDRLDDAAWELDAVEALLAGRPVPERSEPAPAAASTPRIDIPRATLQRWVSTDRGHHRRHRSC